MKVDHFEGRAPLNHVKEKRKETLSLRMEGHGGPLLSHQAFFIDSMREIALLLLLFFAFFARVPFGKGSEWLLLLLFGSVWVLWRACRAGWLGWFTLERLHRTIEQERYEIEHSREEEALELAAIYRAKGFEGELLQKVIDVLMASPDRLLKVMLDEELGLVLEAYEHPLKLSFGAFLGALFSLACLLILYFISGLLALFGAFALLFLSGALSARLERSSMLTAGIWNVAIGALVSGALYFLAGYLLPQGLR